MSFTIPEFDSKSHRSELLADSRRQRQERQENLIQRKSAILIQRFVKKWLRAVEKRKQARLDWDSSILRFGAENDVSELLTLIEKFLSFCDSSSSSESSDVLRLLSLCGLVCSTASTSHQHNFFAYGLFVTSQCLQHPSKRKRTRWMSLLSRLCILAARVLARGGSKQGRRISYPSTFDEKQTRRGDGLLARLLLFATDSSHWGLQLTPEASERYEEEEVRSLLHLLVVCMCELDLYISLRQALSRLFVLACNSRSYQLHFIALLRIATNAVLVDPISASWSCASLFATHVLSLPLLISTATSATDPDSPWYTLRVGIEKVMNRSGLISLCLTGIHSFLGLDAAGNTTTPKAHHAMCYAVLQALPIAENFPLDNLLPRSASLLLNLVSWYPPLTFFSNAATCSSIDGKIRYVQVLAELLCLTPSGSLSSLLEKFTPPWLQLRPVTVELNKEHERRSREEVEEKKTENVAAPSIIHCRRNESSVYDEVFFEQFSVILDQQQLCSFMFVLSSPSLPPMSLVELEQMLNKYFFQPGLTSGSVCDADKSTSELEEEEEEEFRRLCFSPLLASIIRFYTNLLHCLSGSEFSSSSHQTQSSSEKLIVLNAITFSSPILPILWRSLLFLIPIPLGFSPDIHQTWEQIITTNHYVFLTFSLFLQILFHLLLVLDDREFHSMLSPFDINVMIKLTSLLKNFCFWFIWTLPPPSDKSTTGYVSHDINLPSLLSFSEILLHELFRRDVRNSFCSPSLWLLPNAEFQEWKTAMKYSEIEDNLNFKQQHQRALSVLTRVPFVIPFAERLALFRHSLNMKGQTDSRREKIHITVRRTHFVQDAFAAIRNIGPYRFKHGQLHISFLDISGTIEEAVDLGGPLKEFILLLCKKLFSPVSGLFVTATDGTMYPNPSVHLIPDFEETMIFLGMVLGKAVSIGLTIGIPFSGFFLSKLLGQPSDFSQLRNVDLELYESLLKLKHYDGDVRDLALNFTIADTSFGLERVIELRPNGAQIDVDNRNKLRYIYLQADYHLNWKISAQTSSFLHGFSKMITMSSLRIFDSRELEFLIAGSTQPIDIEDWKTHTIYDQNGIERASANHKVVRWFWDCVSGLSSSEKNDLLLFVTANPRPPLEGFAGLNPPFTIRLTSYQPGKSSSPSSKPFWSFKTRKNSDKSPTSQANLPTSGTCFNLLKLPLYKSKTELHEKVRIAIRECSIGFGLA